MEVKDVKGIKGAKRHTYLHTMIGAVGHDDGVVWTNCEASRPGKTSGFAPPHPKLKQLLPFQQVLPSL
jgi:hypothetical protein